MPLRATTGVVADRVKAVLGANKMGRMRIRSALRLAFRYRVAIAVGLAFLATAIGLVIDMSASAPRLAGDDHGVWPPPALVVTVAGGQTLCTRDLVLPGDAARMVMTIGSTTTGGRSIPLPRIGIDYTSAGRPTLTSALRAGAKPGELVSLPLRYPHGPDSYGTLCLHAGGPHSQHLEFGGNAPLSGTTLDGRSLPVRLSILFYRPGRESWWSLLGVLDLRIGLGKSPMFGDWLLPAIVLVALALAFGVARLLLRELK